MSEEVLYDFDRENRKQNIRFAGIVIGLFLIIGGFLYGAFSITDSINKEVRQYFEVSP